MEFVLFLIHKIMNKNMQKKTRMKRKRGAPYTHTVKKYMFNIIKLSKNLLFFFYTV